MKNYTSNTRIALKNGVKKRYKLIFNCTVTKINKTNIRLMAPKIKVAVLF